MLLYEGSIWDPRFDAPVRRVVPTNIGWTQAGLNVMGRGVAQQAAKRLPELAQRYGQICREMVLVEGSDRFLAIVENLILAPVKPLNHDWPHLSWKSPANIDLIRWTIEELGRLNSWYKWQVAIPLLGCGNGRLDPKLVYPMMSDRLNDDFTLVILPAERSRI